MSVSSHPKDGVNEVWVFEVLQNSLKGQQTSIQYDLIRLKASSLLSEGTFLSAYSETRVTGAVFSDGGQINRHMYVTFHLVSLEAHFIFISQVIWL